MKIVHRVKPIDGSVIRSCDGQRSTWRGEPDPERFHITPSGWTFAVREDMVTCEACLARGSGVDLSALVASKSIHRAKVAMGERADCLSGDAWVRWMDLVSDWLKVVDLFGEEHPFSVLCLLALVREAWGDPNLFVELSVSGVCKGWRPVSPRGHSASDGNCLRAPLGREAYPTEVEALAAALLAAPPKGAGS